MLEIKGDQNFVGVVHLDKATRAGIRYGLYTLGQEYKVSARKEMLKKNKTGRIYTVRIRGRTRRHRASAPGQTAANLGGDLRKSIDFNVQGVDGLRFGANTPYAKRLELQQNRPTLKNAIKANYRNATKLIQRGIESKR